MDKLVDYLCIIQARLNSSRLPAKIMLDLAGKTLIERVYETVSESKRIDKIIVATSDEATDDITAKKLDSLSIDYYRGDLNNVLKRFLDASKKYNPKNIIRITADNPLMDARVIDELINFYEMNEVDYSMFTNAIYGLSAEVFSYKSLLQANENACSDYDKEHVTPYIQNKLKVNNTDIKEKYKQPNLSVTIDTLEDYIQMQNFYLYCQKNNIKSDIDNYMKWEKNGH